MPVTHNITSDEFGRYVSEEANFRSRLEQRLASDHDAVRKDLSEIKALVREINGRVGKAEATIQVIQRDLDAIKSEDGAIEQAVEDIKAHGCNQLKVHGEVLETLGWSSKKKAAAAGGLIGVGALIWPVLQEVVATIHAYIERVP